MPKKVGKPVKQAQIAALVQLIDADRDAVTALKAVVACLAAKKDVQDERIKALEESIANKDFNGGLMRGPGLKRLFDDMRADQVQRDIADQRPEWVDTCGECGAHMGDDTGHEEWCPSVFVTCKGFEPEESDAIKADRKDLRYAQALMHAGALSEGSMVKLIHALIDRLAR